MDGEKYSYEILVQSCTTLRYLCNHLLWNFKTNTKIEESEFSITLHLLKSDGMDTRNKIIY